MKNKITTLVLCMVLSIPLMAQLKTDSFFNYSFVGNARAQQYHEDTELLVCRIDFDSEIEFADMDMGEEVSVGDGFIILASVSLFYLVIRRKEVVK